MENKAKNFETYSYNKFPFIKDKAELKKFEAQYKELIKWHKNILPRINSKTIKEIIDDYAKGNDSEKKKSEINRDIESFSGFFREVFYPRFALNLCEELDTKCNKLDQDFDCFFYKSKEVADLLQDYEKYRNQMDDKKNSESKIDRLTLENKIISEAISLFGIPHYQTFQSKLKAKKYKYDPKNKLLILQDWDTDYVISCLKILNELFISNSKTIEIQKDIQKRLCTISNIKNNANIIASLLKMAFSDRIYHVVIGIDYVEFNYNNSSDVEGKNDTNYDFIPKIISSLISIKQSLKDIGKTFNTAKRKLNNASKSTHLLTP